MKAACVLGLILVQAGCNRSVKVGQTGRPGTLEQMVTDDIDLLFMVDDSSSMTTVQQNLAYNFPVFIQGLEQLPGGLPNVHIGIVTSDMGAGAYTVSVPGCMVPDGGNFIYLPRAADCGAAQLNPGQHFIVANADGSANNFTGDLATLFSCLAQVGAGGCGFEQQLASAEAALGPNAPAGNAGFLRDWAFLGIVLITNEDDCSAPPDTQLYDPNQNSNSDPLGPLASFRCTEFGILCDGAPVPRAADSQLTSCTSNETGVGIDPAYRLMPVQHFIDFFRALKPVQDHTLVSLIGGPPQPFATVIDPQTRFTALAHSCSSPPLDTPDAGPPDASTPLDGGTADAGSPIPPPYTGVFADPSVRLSQFLQSFGERGRFVTLCQDSYADALEIMAGDVRDALVRQCVGQDLAMASDPSIRLARPADGAVVDSAQVDCSMVHVAGLEAGAPVEMEQVPPCSAGSSGACWQLIGDQHCRSGVHVTLCQDASCANRLVLPSGEAARLTCAAILPE